MKIDINVPESLNEITLNQFQKYTKLIKDNEPSDFVNQKTIEIFCDIKLNEVAKISYQSTQEILQHLKDIFEVNTKLIPTFKIQDLEFGFEPNLEQITSGAYIDANEYLTDIQTLHKAMAVLYRPIKKKHKGTYTIEEYKTAETYEDIMKYAPINVALGMQVFFYDLVKELMNATNRYLQQNLQTLSEQEKKTLEESGVGINQFMQQLEEISLSLI
jgi:hypothetical protein